MLADDQLRKSVSVQVNSFNQAGQGFLFRTNRDAQRLLQGAFKTCETFARGLEANGTIVRSFHCNQAGDIINARWDADLSNAPFRASMAPVHPISPIGSTNLYEPSD